MNRPISSCDRNHRPSVSMSAGMKDMRAGDHSSHHYTIMTSTIKTPSTAPHLYSSPHSNPLSYPPHTHPNTHSHASSPSTRAVRGSAATPLGSPRLPCSAGQAYPPRLSPPVTRDVEKRSSSPSYFGLVVDDPADPRDSSVLPRHNWTPPSSSVKPFAAAVPKQVPLDPNPEFEAFKRQVDAYRDRGLSLSTTTYSPQGGTSLTTTFIRPKAPRSQTHTSDSTTSSEAVSSGSGGASAHSGAQDGTRMEMDQDSLHDSAYVSGDSKRNSEACLAPPQFPNVSEIDGFDRTHGPPQKAVPPPSTEERGRSLSIASPKVGQPPARPNGSVGSRAASLKADTSGGPGMISPDELRKTVEDPDVRLLLIDVRSAQSYTRSRIRTALNLCIPTTLLKRATFNLQKLQQTFQKPDDKGAFANWKDADCLVVYDACSSEKTEATTAMSMIKKFSNEGYSGGTYILRGGFQVFAEEHPDLLYHQAADNPSSPNSENGPSGLAPVVGGVMLPSTTDTGLNPFFSNIRQNMDLADGVGQMDVLKPKGLTPSILPRWLREAADEADHGKRVSDKFLRIELDEKERMSAAYELMRRVTSPEQSDCLQLCGIEQGDRNRYKDILPFEHSRVKLPTGDNPRSDYINASHIKAMRSNKRYIATQGPLPATFNDFWSVIWDHDVRVIVMLTAETEGGQLKCHSYWNNREYGPVRLRMLSEKKVSLDIDAQSSESGRRRANTTTSAGPATSPTPRQQPTETPYVIIRKFALSHSAHPFAPMREVTHLHYPSWPDFGVPAQASHLLALVELANVMQRAALPLETAAITSPKRTSSNFMSPPPMPAAAPAPATPWPDEPEASSKSRPMLVHCSAGCGRTGAFCTVDSVIDMLKRQRVEKMAKFIRKEDEDAVMEDVLDKDGGAPLGRRASEGAPVRQEPNGTATGRRESDGGPLAMISRRESTAEPQIDTSYIGDEGVDLVQSTVEDFRVQRLSMVQSLRQFVLCYETVLEWVWRVRERGERKRSGSVGVF